VTLARGPLRRAPDGEEQPTGVYSGRERAKRACKEEEEEVEEEEEAGVDRSGGRQEAEGRGEDGTLLWF